MVGIGVGVGLLLVIVIISVPGFRVQAMKIIDSLLKRGVKSTEITRTMDQQVLDIAEKRRAKIVEFNQRLAKLAGAVRSLDAECDRLRALNDESMKPRVDELDEKARMLNKLYRQMVTRREQIVLKSRSAQALLESKAAEASAMGSAASMAANGAGVSLEVDDLPAEVDRLTLEMRHALASAEGLMQMADDTKVADDGSPS